ncbi:MAG: hypothetical protein ACHQT7_03165 [Candidatus Levyibacteriota bacterium]
MRARNSRLSRTTQEKTKKQIAFFAIAIIILVFGALNFGPGLLSGVGSFTSGLKKPTTTTTITTEENTLEAPFIDSIPDATDSAEINISGSSSYSDAQVELYVNGSLYDTTPLTQDQKFDFNMVKLTEGGNSIQARVKKGNQVSPFTRTYNVSYSQGAPKLDISSPTDGQKFSRGDQTITVQGTTDPDNTVTVNGSRAIVDGSGNFSYYLNLSEGDNNLDISAVNQAGQKTDKTLKVNYKP